jgi:hypothetical protein
MIDLPLTSYADASPKARKEYDYWTRRSGRITNMKRLMLRDLPTYHTYMLWYELYDRLVELIGKKPADLFCYAISTTNHCLICSMFFRQILVDAGQTPEQFTLTAIEQLLMDFGAAIAADPNQIPEDIYDQLQQEFNPDQLVLLIGFAGQMVATNYFNMISKVALDDVLEPYATPEFLAQIAVER